MQPWQAPEFTEIEMNAEIGAYQRDPLQEPLPEPRPLPRQAPAAATARRAVSARTAAEAPSQRG